MKEVKGDLWQYPATYICITTNGFVKKNGEAVMGRGCALQATQRFPLIAKDLGTMLKAYGNKVWSFEYAMGGDPSMTQVIITFPVKHNWFEQADPALIQESAKMLRAVALESPDETFVLPRPGCGNGGLRWEDVRPLLLDLPDNIHIITY